MVIIQDLDRRFLKYQKDHCRKHWALLSHNNHDSTYNVVLLIMEGNPGKHLDLLTLEINERLILLQIMWQGLRPHCRVIYHTRHNGPCYRFILYHPRRAHWNSNDISAWPFLWTQPLKCMTAVTDIDLFGMWRSPDISPWFYLMEYPFVNFGGRSLWNRQNYIDDLVQDCRDSNLRIGVTVVLHWAIDTLN